MSNVCSNCIAKDCKTPCSVYHEVAYEGGSVEVNEKTNMQKIAEMLNVDMNIPFDITRNETVLSYSPYLLTEDGLRDKDGSISGGELTRLLTGEYKVKYIKSITITMDEYQDLLSIKNKYVGGIFEDENM